MDSIVHDAAAIIAEREIRLTAIMEDQATGEGLPRGTWSGDAVARLTIPEDTVENFDELAYSLAMVSIRAVASSEIDVVAAFRGAILQGIQLGREIERLSQTDKYTPNT